MGRTTRFLIFIAILCAVLVGSLLPRDPLSVGSQVFDKIEHFGAYMLLILAASWVTGGQRILVIACLLIGLGVLVEFGQGWMQLGREGSILDAVANTLGVIVGGAVVCFWRRRGG